MIFTSFLRAYLEFIMIDLIKFITRNKIVRVLTYIILISQDMCYLSTIFEVSFNKRNWPGITVLGTQPTPFCNQKIAVNF